MSSDRSTNSVKIGGLGVVSPFGEGRNIFWDSLMSGMTALELVHADASDPNSGIWLARSETPSVTHHVERGDRSLELARRAAHEALTGVNLSVDSGVGLVLGTCLQGPSPTDEGLFVLNSDPRDDVVSKLLNGLASDLKLTGPCIAVNTACSSSLSAMIVGAQLIQDGLIEHALCGGVEEFDEAMTFGFGSMGVPDPAGPSPYSRSGGMAYGEAAAFVLLSRNDPSALVELAGWGLSVDAFHPIKPDPSGAGAILAMESALDDAQISPIGINYVNGHGTGTAANDEMERVAFARIFDGEVRPPISSCKGAIGHTIGAAGAIESIASILAIERGGIPPTCGFVGPNPLDGFDFVPNQGREAAIDSSLKVSAAFGGHNAAMIFRRTGKSVEGRDDAQSVQSTPLARIERTSVVSGTGLLEAEHSIVSEQSQFRFPPPIWRRLDVTARMSVLAALAAGIEDVLVEANPDRIGVVYVSQRGPIGAYNQYVEARTRGERKSIPWMFPNISFNAASSRVAQGFKLRGPSMAFVGGSCAGIAAVCFATAMVRSGRADHVLLLGAEDAEDADTRHPRAHGQDGVAAGAIVSSRSVEACGNGIEVRGASLGFGDLAPLYRSMGRPKGSAGSEGFSGVLWPKSAQETVIEPTHGAWTIAAIHDQLCKLSTNTPTDGLVDGYQEWLIEGRDASGACGVLHTARAT